MPIRSGCGATDTEKARAGPAGIVEATDWCVRSSCWRTRRSRCWRIAEDFGHMDCMAESEGAAGRAAVIDAGSDREVELPGKCSRRAAAGSVLRIETPGGGGWGKA